MSKTFSIKVASYKRPEYLKECLKSILGQQAQFDSIEVFDNASGYHHSLIQELSFSGRVRFHINKERVSPNDLFHKMATSVNSRDYVCFFHDDDRLHPEFLKEVTCSIEQHPNCALYASNATVIDSVGIAKGKLLPINDQPLVMEKRHELGRYLADSFLPCPGIVYKTADFLIPAELTQTYGNYWDVVFYGEVAKSGGVFLDGRALFHFALRIWSHWRQSKKKRRQELPKGGLTHGLKTRSDSFLSIGVAFAFGQFTSALGTIRPYS